MALEAVSSLQPGISPQASAASRAASSTGQPIDPAMAGNSEASNAFRETLGAIHDNVTKFQADSSGVSKPDAVEAAKNDVLKSDALPSPWKGAPSAGTPGAGSASAPTSATSGTAGSGASTATPPKSGLTEGNDALRKSFDHAVYVTLVSQVIGGVSQTTSTLIKQQ